MSRTRYRCEPGIAVLGAACVAIAVWQFFWTGWPVGACVLAPALTVLYFSVGHHPETEAHTGPFARCGHTVPQRALRDSDFADDRLP